MKQYTKEEILAEIGLRIVDRKTNEIVDMIANKKNYMVMRGSLGTCDDVLFFALMRLFNIDDALKTKPKSRFVALENALKTYYAE